MPPVVPGCRPISAHAITPEFRQWLQFPLSTFHGKILKIKNAYFTLLFKKKKSQYAHHTVHLFWSLAHGCCMRWLFQAGSPRKRRCLPRCLCFLSHSPGGKKTTLPWAFNVKLLLTTASCSHLDGAVQHAHEPEHSAGGALILFDQGDGAGAGGEDPLLHKRQHVVLLFQLLHQHVLHVHLSETWTIWSLIWPASPWDVTHGWRWPPTCLWNPSAASSHPVPVSSVCQKMTGAWSCPVPPRRRWPSRPPCPAYWKACPRTSRCKSGNPSQTHLGGDVKKCCTCASEMAGWK